MSQIQSALLLIRVAWHTKNGPPQIVLLLCSIHHHIFPMPWPVKIDPLPCSAEQVLYTVGHLKQIFATLNLQCSLIKLDPQ